MSPDEGGCRVWKSGRRVQHRGVGAGPRYLCGPSGMQCAVGSACVPVINT